MRRYDPSQNTSAKENRMSDHVYKLIELTGSSTTGIEDAVNNAVTRAAKTIRNMRWVEILETRGEIQGGKVNHWQVTIKVGFTLEQPA
jgi:flavin-binding protein dodecin